MTSSMMTSPPRPAGGVLVEGAGGFYSPLAPGVLNADLAAALPLPVLLVAADRLGAISHTLLTVEAIKRRGLALVGVVLNQVDPASDPRMNNPADLSRWLGRPVIVTGRFDMGAANPGWMMPCPAPFATRNPGRARSS